MDNYVKDNKNQHWLPFLLLLTVRDVFEEVKLGFLVISHTHEDTSRKPRIYDWCLRLVFSRRRHFTTILLLVA
jgi:hypothetical protein